MNKIDEMLRDTVEVGGVPGVVAMAADAEGILYQGAFGLRRLPDGSAMTTDTVFRIASMTKAITATAAMQLVEQERIALDAPMGSVAPELAEPKVLEGFDASGQPLLRPAHGAITLRQLLTHTAGFGYDVWNADLLRYHRETGLPTARTGRLAGLSVPLTFDPGTRWQYGINIDWVGRIVEALSGMDLERYFRRFILGPLGMANTSYLVKPHMEPRLASVHSRTKQGLQPLELDNNPPREFFPGGGGLYATAGDYMTFLRMLLAGGSWNSATILQPETVRVMMQNHIGALLVEPMRSAVPASSNDVELFAGMPKKWGLSFLINTEPGPHGRSAGSLAWAGLNNTYYWLDPFRKVAGLLMTQVLPFGDARVLDLLDRFESAVYRELTTRNA
jgi:CubicO group peptidase (beta-lactamase class C family)